MSIVQQEGRPRAHRLTALLLAASLLSAPLLGGCQSGSAGGDQTVSTTETVAEALPTAPVTEAETGPVTPATDIPRTDITYRTSTDLVLPDYTDTTGEGILPATRDVFADSWTMIDGAGRTTPDAADTRTPSDRQVGIFYFLWRDHDQNSLNPVPASDHYAAYLEGGMEKLYEVMQEGGEGHPHYWAEPYFGYYSSNDEWVLRRHAYMLADAGVDFVFFDNTNGNLHTVSYTALLKVWEEVRREGVRVPKIVFFIGADDREFCELWDAVYAKDAYKDLWFYWNGKPLLLMTNDVKMTEEQKDFFTVRYSWAVGTTNWYADRRRKACWPWADKYKQNKGYAEDGKTFEQMVVMCGFWATNGVYSRTAGRSFSKNRIPAYEGDWDFGYALMNTTTGLGLAFAEEFDFAIRADPSLIMITGWNEWIAGRWSGGGAGAGGAGQIMAGEYVISNDPKDPKSTYFVDNFNPEFSRDIEPMKGGFGDNYLCQMAEYIRIYKGSRVPESASGQWAIDMDGSVGQWYAVGPEYRDTPGDITERMSPGHVGGNENGMYVNFSGRNDMVTAKVSNDSRYLYFYVECASDITPAEGTNWMNLFLNTDGDDQTGWNGFDFVLNRTRNDSVMSVDAFPQDGGWSFTQTGTAAYTVNGRVLQIRVEKSLVGFTGTMDFKWADNSVPTGDPMEFLDQGDTAPNGRFRYRFTTEATEQKLPDCLTADMIVLKSRSYNAFVGGRSVRLCEDNLNGVLLVSGQELYLPAAFLASVGIPVSGEPTVDHYGIPYVRANALLTAAGKTVTLTQEGLVVIADQPVTDETVLRTLYRALY